MNSIAAGSHAYAARSTTKTSVGDNAVICRSPKVRAFVDFIAEQIAKR